MSQYDDYPLAVAAVLVCVGAVDAAPTFRKRLGVDEDVNRVAAGDYEFTLSRPIPRGDAIITLSCQAPNADGKTYGVTASLNGAGTVLAVQTTKTETDLEGASTIALADEIGFTVQIDRAINA